MPPDHLYASAPPTSTSAPGRPHRSRAGGDFAAARAAADEVEAVQRTRAALTVAGHSLDPGDCVELLSMLGLPDPDTRFTSRTSQGARP